MSAMHRMEIRRVIGLLRNVASSLRIIGAHLTAGRVASLANDLECELQNPRKVA